jgi:hypothetical protein
MTDVLSSPFGWSSTTADVLAGVFTGFQRNMDPERLRNRLGGRDPRPGDVPEGWKSVQQGAATSVLLVAGVTGRYFEDCDEAERVDRGGDYLSAVAPYALDPANAERLWDVSLRMSLHQSHH